VTVASPTKKPWKDRIAEVWPYATSSTTVLFVSCVAFGWFVSWRGGASGIFSYVLAAADPAVAAILMLVVCLLQPNVFAGRRFRLPHVATLPTLFVSIVFGIKSLARNSESGLRRFEGAERYDLIWLDHRVALQAWLVLVLVMAVLSAIIGEKDGVE
jgi:hypothetical protein